MSAVTDALDRVNAAIDAEREQAVARDEARKTQIADLNTLVEELKAQVEAGNGGEITVEQLDALAAKVEGIVTPDVVA